MLKAITIATFLFFSLSLLSDLFMFLELHCLDFTTGYHGTSSFSFETTVGSWSANPYTLVNQSRSIAFPGTVQNMQGVHPAEIREKINAHKKSGVKLHFP